MSSHSREKVNAQIRALLDSLSVEERTILSDVLKIESANLHLERPRVKEEILEVVRRVIK